MVEERSLLSRWRAATQIYSIVQTAVQSYSSGESAVRKRVLQDSQDFDSNQKGKNYVEGFIMLIVRLYASLETLVQLLVNRARRKVHRIKMYPDPNGRMLATANKPFIGSLSKFVKHWGWEKVTVE